MPRLFRLKIANVRTPYFYGNTAFDVSFRIDLCEGTQAEGNFPRVASAPAERNIKNTVCFSSSGKGTIIALQPPSEVPIVEWSVDVRLLLNSQQACPGLKSWVSIPEWKYRASS